VASGLVAGGSGGVGAGSTMGGWGLGGAAAGGSGGVVTGAGTGVVSGAGAGSRSFFAVLHLSPSEFQVHALSVPHEACSVWRRQGSLGWQPTSNRVNWPRSIPVFMSWWPRIGYPFQSFPLDGSSHDPPQLAHLVGLPGSGKERPTVILDSEGYQETQLRGQSCRLKLLSPSRHGKRL
jgi:hypothetical protein